MVLSLNRCSENNSGKTWWLARLLLFCFPTLKVGNILNLMFSLLLHIWMKSGPDLFAVVPLQVFWERAEATSAPYAEQASR